jgi:hypothetical protein
VVLREIPGVVLRVDDNEDDEEEYEEYEEDEEYYEKSATTFYFTSVCTKSINLIGNFHLLISSLKHDKSILKKMKRKNNFIMVWE